jgi:PAS domain S-box-containing protein
LSSEQQIRLAIDHLREGVQLIDRQWRYVYVNAAAAEHGRSTPERLIGCTMMECYPGIEATDLFRALERVMQTGRAETFSNVFRYATGEERWFDIVIDPVPDGICVLSMDVTEHRAALERHEAFRDRAAFAIEAAGAGIWEFNVVTGTVRWSDSVGGMLGHAGEFEGTLDDFRRRIHPDDLAMVDAAVARSIAHNEPYRAHFRVVWPDGSVRWLAATGRVTTNAEGRPIAILGIAIDITSRKLLEQQLQQAQKMESLGQLAGSIAHDFNNVLTAILGFSELLLAEADPGDARRAAVEEIKKAAGSGKHLTTQLLAFSRRQPLEPKRVHLNDIVRGSEGIIRQLLGKGIVLETRLAPRVPPVHGDAGQLQQILVNLAVNARDAMPNGGRLLIETAEGGREEDHPIVGGRPVAVARYVVLTVTDTGVGMPPEILTRVFEPFFSTKGPEKGTGLGLSTVYGIVRQSGGYVDVTSAPGAGTTFRIGLPGTDDPVLSPHEGSMDAKQ